MVVPALDPADQVPAGLGMRGPSALVRVLAFEGPEERLGRSVVPALTGQSGLAGARVGWRCLVRLLSGLSVLEVAEAFFVLADLVGDGFESGS